MSTPLRGVTRVRQRRGCSGGSGLSCGCSRTPCRCRRTRSGVSGRSRSPRSASPRGTTGTPCAQARPRDEPTGQRPPRCSPSSSRQRTDSDTGHGCPGAPVPGPGNPHRRRAPAAVRNYSRHASFMHAELRLYAFLASSGRFERFRGEKRGCCVRSQRRRVPKTRTDGQSDQLDRSAGYLCMERDGQVAGYPVGWQVARAAGAGWLAWLVAAPCPAVPAVPPACLPPPADRQHGVRTVAEWSCAGWLRRHRGCVRWCAAVVPCTSWAAASVAWVWWWVPGQWRWWCVADDGAGSAVHPRWMDRGLPFAPRPVAMSQAGRTLTPSSATDQANAGVVNPVPTTWPRLARYLSGMSAL